MEENIKKHFLFICTSNIERSPMAEAFFEDSEKVDARSAGFFPMRDSKKITNELIRWASTIFVMDEEDEFHKTQLLQNFPDSEEKEIIVLGIPNDLTEDDSVLEEALRTALEKGGWL